MEFTMSQVREDEDTVLPAEAPRVRVNVPDLDVSELEGADSAIMLRAISRNCLAVKVSVSAISNERQVKDASVSIDNRQIPGELLAGARFKLIPSSIRDPLVSIAHRARTLPAVYGTPFVGGAYLLPLAPTNSNKSVAELALSELKTLKEKYEDKARELRPAWEKHINELANKYPEDFSRIRQWLVDGPTFVSKHRVSTMLFPLGAGLPADFDSQLERNISELAGNRELSQSDRSVLERLKPFLIDAAKRAADNPASILENVAGAEAWINQAKSATSEAIASAVRTMIQQPITEFAETLASVEDILAKGGALRNATLSNLRKAYDKLEGFSFMAPADMRQRLSSVKSVLYGLDHKEVNASEAAARNLAKHFSEVREEITTREAQESIYGEFRRFIAV
jgi:hypothetical protein